jgi:hypothetical protein
MNLKRVFTYAVSRHNSLTQDDTNQYHYSNMYTKAQLTTCVVAQILAQYLAQLTCIIVQMYQPILHVRGSTTYCVGVCGTNTGTILCVPNGTT